MKRLVTGAAITLCLAASLPVLAASKTVVLSIPTMDCATCPILIRAALLKVAGVFGAKVSYEHREARVTFDDTVTGLAALKKATRDVGYPSLLADPQT